MRDIKNFRVSLSVLTADGENYEESVVVREPTEQNARDYVFMLYGEQGLRVNVNAVEALP